MRDSNSFRLIWMFNEDESGSTHATCITVAYPACRGYPADGCSAAHTTYITVTYPACRVTRQTGVQRVWAGRRAHHVYHGRLPGLKGVTRHAGVQWRWVRQRAHRVYHGRLPGLKVAGACVMVDYPAQRCFGMRQITISYPVYGGATGTELRQV